MSAAGIAQRIAYGALFVIVLPTGLIAWARAVDPVISLTAVHSIPVGAGLVVLGIFLMLSGAVALMTRGGGLPMNAFPPPRLVQSGIYRWIRNPMYIGFGLASAGVSIALGSPAGLWLVTPVVSLGAAALVYGYERHDLARRLGAQALEPPLLSLPRGNGDPPTLAQRAAVYAWVMVPWLLAYFSVQALGRASDVFSTELPVEHGWPVLQWTEIFYFSVYLFVPITVLLIRTRRDLRQFAVQGIIATVVVTLTWLIVPAIATNRPFEPAGALGRLLAFEQRHSNGVAAFPAFHVLWALIAAQAWGANTRATHRPLWARIGWTWAALITVSCLTTGMHTLIEVAAALAAYLPLRRPLSTWLRIRQLVEWIANSWREWRIGPVRVINHGAYAAAAAGVGFLIAASAAGRERFGAVLWVGLCIIAGAGLWAQALEGSSKLLRPFGWYGGVAGGVLGALTAQTTGVPLLPLFAAFTLAAPWIQILGRLRCLVQGCCHGGPARPDVGICYRHPRSRVNQLSNLAGIPIHPTPLYSIAGNLVVGIILFRLRGLAAPDSLIVGIYFILGGIARFVEESYRAEPQTPILGGLRLYQWFALVSVLAGIVCTTLTSGPVPSGFAPLEPRLWIGAIVMGLITGLAMGVDFPASNRRFSRLAGAD